VKKGFTVAVGSQRIGSGLCQSKDGIVLQSFRIQGEEKRGPSFAIAGMNDSRIGRNPALQMSLWRAAFSQQNMNGGRTLRIRQSWVSAQLEEQFDQFPIQIGLVRSCPGFQRNVEWGVTGAIAPPQLEPVCKSWRMALSLAVRVR